MRKILYFITGLLIAFFIFHPNLYAYDLFEGYEDDLSPSDFDVSASCHSSTEFLGYFNGSVSRTDLYIYGGYPVYRGNCCSPSKLNQYYTDDNGKIWYFVGNVISIVDGSGNYYCTNEDNNILVYAYFSYDSNPPATPDTDGDGFPDDQDMYPEDSTPYQVKLITYYTTDGDPDGDHVFEIWITDRGDYFYKGEDPPVGRSGIIVQNPIFIDPVLDSNTGITSGIGSGEIEPGQPTYTTGIITGDSEVGAGSGFTPGEQSTGTETDNEALQGIQDNTGKTADNVARLGDYMQDLNAAIQNMDRNISLGSVSGDSESMEIPEVTQSQQDDLNNLSIEGALTGNISGEISEGVDYDQPGALSDESFFTDFLEQNPLIAAFQSSGFETSDQVCSITLDLGSMGTHDLSLCEFESGFELFGNLLFAFCSIGGLIMVMRG